MATARRLKSGSWRVRIYTGTVNGHKIYKSFTSKDHTSKDKATADEYLLTIVVEN